MKIRYGRRGDIPELVNIYDFTFNEHRRRNPDDFPSAQVPGQWEAVLEKMYPVATLIRRKKDSDICQNILVCEAPCGRIAGYLLFGTTELNWPYEATDFYVFDISITPEYRHRGIATMLLDRLRGEVEDGRAFRIRACVWTGNKASETMFAKRGFEAVATEFRYFEQGAPAMR